MYGESGQAGQSDYLSRKGTPFQSSLSGAQMFEQSPEDQEKVKLLWKMFMEAKAWRSQWDKNWSRFWNEWEGNHFYGKVVHTLTRAVINQIFSSTETFIGHVNDAMDYPECKARRSETRINAKMITEWLKYEWEQCNAGFELEHVLRSAAVAGVGWAEIAWDETLHGNRGDCGFDPVDEKFIFLSPNSRNLKEAFYLIDARNVPREYVKRTWPQMEEMIPTGPWDGSLINTRVYQGGSPGTDNYAQFRTTDDSRTSWTGSSGDQSSQRRANICTLMKAYIKQEDGTMRLLVVCNGIVLQDGESPYEDDDYPYVQFNLIPTLDTYCGRSMVQFVEGLQEIMDLSLSYMLDQQRYSSDPMLIVDIDNVEEGSLIDNMPGAVLFNKSQNGEGYHWLQAPGFNAAWVEIQKMITEYMDSVLGRVDVLQGNKPPGVNTLGGLEIIRDEANVRVRNLIRWVKSSVKRVYLLMLSRLRQFATQERTIRIVGKFGLEDFMTVNPSVGMTATGQPVQQMTIPDDAEFDVEFGEESEGGKQALQEQTLALAGLPAEDGLPMVTRAYVLEKLGVDEAPELMQQFEAIKQQQQQMQQQQMAAQAAPQGGGGQPQTPQDQMSQNPADVISALFGG